MIVPLEVREGRVLKLRLELGLCGLDSVEHWADEQIVRHDEPAYELVELALARSLNERDVIRILESVVGSDFETSDLVLALAQVEPRALTLEGLYALLERVSAIFYSTSLSEIAGEADASWLALYETSEVRDSFFALQNGRLTAEKLRVLADNHFRRLREIAVTLGVIA